MNDFEKRLLAALDTMATELQNQSKAIAQVQTALGELSDDVQKLFTRLNEVARGTAQSERRLDRIEEAAARRAAGGQ